VKRDKGALLRSCKKLEKQLKREVQQLLKLAEQADAVNLPDGMSIPEELERRETRLAAIAQAKKKIEASGQGATEGGVSAEARRASRAIEAHQEVALAAGSSNDLTQAARTSSSSSR